MRCKCCNKIQTAEEQKLYDDFCRRCAEISQQPDDDHQDQGLEHIYLDDGWLRDER